MAQLLLSSGSSNDTDLIDRVFERLEDGDALENVDEFLTQLTVDGRVNDTFSCRKEESSSLQTYHS